MKQLINPAIALMNRLPMVYKFSLISILFLLPIGALSWLVISGLNQSVQTMNRGVEGLEQLQQVDVLVDAAMDYRDYRSPAIIKDENAIRVVSEEAADAVAAAFEALTAQQRSFDTSGAWLDQVESLRNDWEALRADDNYQGSFDPQFKYYQEFVQKAQALLSATIEISGLSQGASRENQLILGLVRDSLPAARTVIGRAKSYGIYALVEGQVGYALSETLNEIYDQLTNRSSLLTPALSVTADASPALVAKAGEALSKVDESLMVVRDELDQNVITPMRLEMPWTEYDSLMSEQLGYYDELKQASFEVVEANLRARLDSEINQRTLILVALVAVLLVVVYLYIGFFMSVRTAINRFSQAARSVAAGDMTTHIHLRNRDELGELTTEFNNMTDRIAELIRSVSRTTADVDQQATRVNDTAAANSEAVARQMEESGQINEAMNQMVDAVNEVTESAHRVADSAGNAERDTETGRGVVADTVKTINHLATEISGAVEVINRVSKDSDNISQVLVEIKAIAEQTNLLALNAAIEAARAGEAGRGFSVVADEVRSLARKTQESTDRIAATVKKVQEGSASAVSAIETSLAEAGDARQQAEHARQALDAIGQGVVRINDLTTQIAAATEEQSSVSEEINRSITGVSEVAVQSAASIGQVSSSGEELARLAGDLKDMSARFVV